MEYLVAMEYLRCNGVSALSRSLLLTLYKPFLRSHLDYGGVIYDQPDNSSFIQKSEFIQYNAALTITSAITCSSEEKLYQELRLNTLKMRRWYKKLCLLYKIVNKKIRFMPDQHDSKETFGLCH